MFVENASPRATTIARMKRRIDISGPPDPTGEFCRWARRGDYRGVALGSNGGLALNRVTLRPRRQSAGDATGAGPDREPPPATALSATAMTTRAAPATIRQGMFSPRASAPKPR